MARNASHAIENFDLKHSWTLSESINSMTHLELADANEGFLGSCIVLHQVWGIYLQTLLDDI